MKKITVEELGEKISAIVNQDGDEKTDGECIDEIIELLKKKKIYMERKE
jgi:hypothetical protein